MKKIYLLILLIILLFGCAPAGKNAAPAKIDLPLASQADPEGVLILSLGGEPSVINPILSLDTASSAIEGLIFNGLIRINSSLEVEPELALSWKVSEDGRIWTFYLRKDVYWHDGRPFTAQDVKFTFDSILNPKINSVRRSDYIIDGDPIIFKVIDKYTFQAILPKPFAPFLTHMGMGIVPKHILSGQDINISSFNRNPIGTGPFMFGEWHTGDYVKVKRNNKYFKGRPKLLEIVLKIIPDGNSALLALEAGEVDEAGIPAREYKRMQGISHLNVFTYDSMLYTYLGFNLENPLFSDKKVRQAMAYATDKEQLISLIFKGLASPAYCPSAPVSWAYSDDVEKYIYNPEKAKELLFESGYKMENGQLVKDGDPFEFTLLLNQGNKEREKAAVILQQQYKKIGIKMNIRVMEWSALLKIINSPKDPKEFDAVLIGWSLGLDPDSYSIWHSSQYPGGFNFIKYQNKKADKLLEKGRTTINKEKRKKIYAELFNIISAD
ncbi:MAG: peptide-binding protein, partial [bacterium]